MKKELLKISGFAYRNLIIFLRSVFTIFEVIFWPLIGLISVGLMGNFVRLEQKYFSFILTGALGFSIMNVCQLDVAFSLLFDLWAKSLKHTFVAPVRAIHFVAGASLIGITRGILVWIFVSVLSYFLFKFNILSVGGLANFHFLCGIFLNSIYIGILVCVFLLNFGYRAEVAAWSLTSIIMLVCGFYYPANILPEKIYLISRFLPLSYFLEYYRSFFGFPVEKNLSLFYGYFLSIFYILFTLLLLEFSVKKAEKTGIIMRMSE